MWLFQKEEKQVHDCVLDCLKKETCSYLQQYQLQLIYDLNAILFWFSNMTEMISYKGYAMLIAYQQKLQV